MPAPVRVAVVGAGGIAKACHLPALRSMAAAVEVVAVCDVDLEAARRMADDWTIPRYFTDLDQLLADQTPDLVIVSTPPSVHREPVIAALNAGAWVWCEKPPVLSLAEYDEIARHERAGGPYVSYVFQHRFGSAAQRLRELVANGALGRPLVALCNTLWYRPPGYFEVPWRGRWDTEGGGPTMGHGIHQIDLLLSLLGDWTEMVATAATLDRETETEDVSFAIVKFASGAIASVTNSLLSPREVSSLRFDFTHATVELEHVYGYHNANWRWTPSATADVAEASTWTPVEDESGSHQAQLRRLLDSYHRGERPAASGADGRRVLEFVAGLYQSAFEGRTVRRADLDSSNPFYRSMAGESPAEFADLLKPTKGDDHAQLRRPVRS
ncbi:putative dehydrogenase [Kribbella aluminosa]|uniref:Dehydrogenase n=1 Tax=Kribbella aluminosa TaxID=416017 RepID=A0ABS4UIJ4_9ACTN|nr:Gfo/Idh/MocA family oxidoreductase [Kribbella aluminosa]MBP2351473.1 putative dehydrogenase [Kribbella aluminosa]